MKEWIDYPTWRGGAPAEIAGEIVVHPRLAHLGIERPLLVWLPPSYAGSAGRYPVLYFQDGQNLFDAQTAFAAPWHLDRALLARAQRGVEAIAVAIPNGGAARIDEYSPFHQRGLGGGRAGEYLRFLLEAVIPCVEASFRVAPGAAARGLVGSSLGGLFALYGFFERPDLFGRCGAMSPSLQWAHWAPLVYLETRRPQPRGRLYLDGGAREGSAGRLARWSRGRLPRPYLRGLRRAHAALRELGYRDGADLLYVEEAAGEHSEDAWSRRLPGALDFLLR